MRSYRILGVDIVDQTMEEAVADMGRLIHADGPRSLFFANAHTLNLATSSPAFRTLLNGASRVYGDGTGVRWAARMRGIRLRANLNGTDLMPLVLESVPDIRCFLLGSAPELTDEILAKARARFPRVTFVGAHHGYLDDARSAQVVRQIADARANLVLVAMGNPLQERWIARYGPELPGALCVGVGALLDYWHGSLVRAPQWMRKRGVEWLYRVFAHPGRASRYLLGNPLFIARIVRAWPGERSRDTGLRP